MLTAAVVICVAFFGLFVFFFLLKRTLRLFVRLALLGLLLLVLLAGAAAWWWYDPLGGGAAERSNRGRATPTPARPSRAR